MVARSITSVRATVTGVLLVVATPSPSPPGFLPQQRATPSVPIVQVVAPPTFTSLSRMRMGTVWYWVVPSTPLEHDRPVAVRVRFRSGSLVVDNDPMCAVTRGYATSLVA